MRSYGQFHLSARTDKLGVALRVDTLLATNGHRCGYAGRMLPTQGNPTAAYFKAQLAFFSLDSRDGHAVTRHKEFAMR